MTPLPTQPRQERPLQQLGVEPVGLGPAMFRRYRDTRGMDHMRLDPTRTQPPRQPEAVAAGFEGQRNPRDLFTSPESNSGTGRPASAGGGRLPSFPQMYSLMLARFWHVSTGGSCAQKPRFPLAAPPWQYDLQANRTAQMPSRRATRPASERRPRAWFAQDSPWRQSGFELPVPRALEERCRNVSCALGRWCDGWCRAPFRVRSVPGGTGGSNPASLQQSVCLSSEP